MRRLTVVRRAALLGIDEVYAVGGAQAVAMFAYGAGPCRKVDLVTGPGNIYTVSAKRLLKGVVGIDSEAGPTEIAILADETADPAYVASSRASLSRPSRVASLFAGSWWKSTRCLARAIWQSSASAHLRERRVQRGRMSGQAKGGHTIAFGEFALMTEEPAWITARQIEFIDPIFLQDLAIVLVQLASGPVAERCRDVTAPRIGVQRPGCSCGSTRPGR